ncbi:hypothetical protein F4777DRAFT_64334 [Nemania sp. FL0916]|nr:hypothetical protein F4777DRAFT_64334 [Nemania sp. FL0916]
MVPVADTDAPMSDALQVSDSGSASAATRPKRQFAPQLIEHTTKSSVSKSRQRDDPSHTDADANTNTNTNTVANGNGIGKVNTNRNANSDAPTHDNSNGRSNNSSITPDNTPTSNPTYTQMTRDVSARVDNSDTSSAPRPSTKPIRRFAPVPIETTFDSYRVANKNALRPAPEPTPDPSPTTSHSSRATSPAPGPVAAVRTQTGEQERRPKRRFAPQLIETTRRARRAGQEGPATKPTDKTDITPGTNHIYAPRPERKQGALRPNHSSAGSKSSSKSGAGLALALARAGNTEGGDEALPRCPRPRRQRPINVHPNTRRATHSRSYHPELDTILSSESGNSSEDEGSVAAPVLRAVPALSDAQGDHGARCSTRTGDLRDRRESCDEEISGYLLGVAARDAHRQREYEQALSAFPNGLPPQGVEHFFVRDNSEDDLQIGDDEPPLRHGPSQLLRRTSTDSGWAVNEMRAHAEKLARMRAETHLSIDDHSDQSGMALPPDDPLWTTKARADSRDSAMGSSMGPLPPTHSSALFAKSSHGPDKPPSSGLRASPFGMHFAFRTDKLDDSELGRMRKAASPPMLGADLSFRTCPSPKHTRMEPNQPYAQFERLENSQRDASGATGLWRGYCSSQTNRLDAPALQPPDLLHTPGLSRSSVDPFASAFGNSTNGSGTQSPTWAPSGKQMSLHKQALAGLEDRLEKEMIRKEREEAILAEFDDAFTTQVYNYLSLGYAATARAFDDELSKISGICVEELRRDDCVKVEKGFMYEIEMSVRCESSDSSGDSSGEEHTVPRQSFGNVNGNGKRQGLKPPRWKALRLYIREWARQHPCLNGDDNNDLGPPAWGVRARRGSWAI